MTRKQIHTNFIAYMEGVRAEHGYSIAKMAEIVGIPTETYKNIIYGKSNCIDIEIACRMYESTHDWWFQMCGYRTSDFEILDKYLALDDSGKEFLLQIIDAALKKQNAPGRRNRVHPVNGEKDN